MGELAEAENSGFKQFLTANNFHSLKDYELARSTEAARVVNDRKNHFQHRLDKCRSELEFLSAGNED
jgi:hypothetical protein